MTMARVLMAVYLDESQGRKPDRKHAPADAALSPAELQALDEATRRAQAEIADMNAILDRSLTRSRRFFAAVARARKPA